MFAAVLVASEGVNRILLQRLLDGRVFALAFRREAFASLDVSYFAAALLPPCRRHSVKCGVLDELLLALLLRANFRAEPCDTLGGCEAPISPSQC